MTVFVTILLLVGVAVAGFTVRLWLNGRLSPLKDHSKKDEELNAEDVEIVIQKPVHERRLKLALPDLSSIQIHSPVVPMKSSIRSALKELRSRQMVQSLCSKFESRMKVSDDADESAKGVATKSIELLQPARARRRDARDVTLAPVLLTSEMVKETDVTANARSNNLNKFLRSYASNLDISAKRRVVMTTDVISAERSIVMSTDAEDDVEQPLLDQTDEIAAPLSDALGNSDVSDMSLDLDLQTLRLEVECSNQCDSPPTAGSEEEVAVLVDATDCGPVVDESLGESDEGNNVDTTMKLSTAFTITDWKISDITKLSDCNPELCLDPPAKAALDLFKQQVPSNRRARTIATLNF